MKGIQNFVTNSLLDARPMPKDKLRGLRARTVPIDDWLSDDAVEDVAGAVEQGAFCLSARYLRRENECII